VKTKYEQEQIAYLIIVGDSDDVPVASTSPNPSDTLYGLVSGDDKYHDLFISRISASDLDQLANQLTKILNYEKAPDTAAGEWYSRACMVGSDEGASASAFGLDDWQLLDVERDVLIGSGFSHVDQIYDPAATSAKVITAWNGGRSLFYYLGHGSETAWSTTGFDVDDVTTSLTNGLMLPFVMNGNCKNGNFTRSTGDCLAEAMMKVGTAESPAGTVAVVGSTTNMDWDPPIVMLQAFTDYHTGALEVTAGEMTFSGESLFTAGGLTFFSVQRAMDYCYATSGEGATAAEKIMEQTHLFGDCTLGLRSTTPLQLNVVHDDLVIPQTDFAVTVTDAAGTPVADATVCLYRADGVQLVGTTDANGTVTLVPGVIVGDPLVLTVYERNAVPYQVEVPIGDGVLLVSSESVLPAAFVLESYSFSPTALGGDGQLTWTLGETAPRWLDIDALSGTISGTPSSADTLEFDLQVTDSGTPQATAVQSATLSVGYPVEILTTSLPNGTVDQAYSASIEADGSFGAFTFEADSQALPPGLTMSDDGAIQGTPTVAGNFVFTVTAVDQQQRTDSQALSLSIEAADTITINTRPALDDATRLEPYSVVLNASGGTGSGFAWSIAAGALPPGLTLDPDGTLSGTPTLEGDYAFTLNVSDDAAPAHTTKQESTLLVYSPVYFTSQQLPDAVLAVDYSTSAPVSGSSAPFSFSAALSTSYEVFTETSSFTEDNGELQPWFTSSYSTDTEWQLDLDMTFPFYGTEYTECKVGNNGYLVFGGTSPAPLYYKPTEATFSNVVMIAPFWSDLSIAGGGDPAVVYYHFEAQHMFIIEWYNVHLDGDDENRFIFQAIIYDEEYHPTATGDNKILFIYKYIQNLPGWGLIPYASVGISSPDGKTGIGYTFRNYYHPAAARLRNRMAIMFTTTPPYSRGITLGTVYDAETDEPLTGVEIKAYSEYGFEAVSQSGDDGEFELVGLYGLPSLRFDGIKQGYRGARTQIDTLGEDTLEVDLHLTHPVIRLYPDELNLELASDHKMMYFIRLLNEGTGPFVFTATLGLLIEDNSNMQSHETNGKKQSENRIRFTDWLDLEPRTGSVNSGDYTTLTLTLDTRTLEEGDYSRAIVIEDELAELSIVLPVYLNVDSNNGLIDVSDHPLEWSLSQNFPNPFNSMTTIGYSIKESGSVRLTIFDLNGRVVARLVDEYRNAGTHRRSLNGADLPNGIYLYQLKAGDFLTTKKMVLIK